MQRTKPKLADTTTPKVPLLTWQFQSLGILLHMITILLQKLILMILSKTETFYATTQIMNAALCPKCAHLWMIATEMETVDKMANVFAIWDLKELTVL